MTIIVLIRMLVLAVVVAVVCGAGTLGANVMQYKNGKENKKRGRERSAGKVGKWRQKKRNARVLKEMLTFKLFVSAPHTIVDRSAVETESES